MPVTQILSTVGRIGGPVSTYTLTPEANNVDEGTSLTFDVGGTNVPGGTYYWTVETNAGDFATTNGTVEIPTNYPVTGSNLVSFTVTPTADATTDGSETFTVALRSGSITGTILVTSAAVTINDTSFAIGGQYVFNGTPTSWATTNATATTYGAYTYPDETSGSLHTLTGSEFLMSGNIGNNTVLNINLWFYPTANNLIIMGEMGQPAENSSWHYSMLDIDNTNHLRGRLWEFVGVTSTGTVTLNAWNHAYLYYNSVNDSIGLSLNNETAVTTDTGDRHTSDTSETYLGIGVFDSQNMSSNTRYQGKFAAPVIDTTLTGSNYSSTKAKYLPPLSLVFNQPQGDYLSTPASSDWNLGTTGTIEFWLNANNASSANIHIPGGQWGLINQGGWYYGMPNNSSILIGLEGGKLSIAQSNTDDVKFVEPTAGVWTHVAVVYDSGTQKVFYNGVEQTKTDGNYLGNGWTNSTSDLYIGRLAPSYQSHFDGKMALVRISNTAKYTAPFTPTTTYGVEADTKLFLSLTTPLVDSMSHTITNNGVTLSTTVPATFAPLSLLFGGDASPDYLTLPASSDWNLGTTWTIEFWSKSNIASTGNAGPYAVMSQGYGNGDYIDLHYLNGSLTRGTSVLCNEPTPNVWTHVALSSSSGALTVYYNGVQQYSQQANYTLSDTSLPLYIGRRVNFQHFNGRLALVRISNTAKYATTFTPTVTYGVEADTKLFLGKAVPLIDAKGHAITNTSVTLSTDFPVTIIITNMSVGFNSRAATVDFTSTVSATTTGTIFFAWGGGTSGPHSVTVNPGSNTYTSPTLSLSGAGSDLIAQVTIASGPNACTSNIYTGSWSVICLVEGTMVTMADGSHKAIEDIRYNDLLRVWNFDLGEFSEALPVFVKQEETHAEHYRFTFSDGTVLRTVGHHVFNKQAGEFTMLVRDTTPVGTITFNEFGEEVTLIAKETIEEPVRFYNVWTQYHLNLFAQGILTSNRFNNIYPIQDMKFVKDNRALRPLEEFANIDPKYISGLRLQEQPAQYTAEYIRDYVENKLERLDIANTTVIT